LCSGKTSKPIVLLPVIRRSAACPEVFCGKPLVPTPKENAASIETMRDNKITLAYLYTDKNGELLSEIVVKPEMYSKK
jgi:hypothetical protein